jgi:tRNA(Arg) A34 adenosine deaminase TadA
MPIIQDVNSRVTSANDAAQRVQEQAELAASVSCYGIGGIIVENSTGRVIKAWGNRAQGQLKSGEFYPLDPSNHGETQLVRWYYDNQEVIRQELGYVPKPSELTVVTSLDPCAMCAGGLCAAGFHVGVIAPDSSGGGVNWDSSGTFPNAPVKIQNQLNQLFGYYKADGIPYRKVYQGSPILFFNTETLTQQVYQANVDAFANSAAQVSKTRKEARINPANLKDPLTLPKDNATILRLQQRFPEALTLRLTDKADISDSGLMPEDVQRVYYKPSLELYQKLQQAVDAEPGAENAVAVIDRFGNLLTIGVDKPSEGPIETALLNGVSDYSRFLFSLISDASDSSTPFKYKQSDAYNYLAPAANATYIYLKCPSAGRAQTLKDLGLFGSASGDIIQYIESPAAGTKRDFENSVRGLPIYYLRSERLSPVQSLPDGLEFIVTNGADAGPGSLRRAIKDSNRLEGYQAIRIESTEPIRLQSGLPEFVGPIDLASNPSNPQAVIHFRGHGGLRFGKQANGSSLSGLKLKNYSGFAIQTKTGSLQTANLQFDISNGSPQGLEQQGSIKNPRMITGNNLQGWNRGQASLSRQYKIDTRPIEVMADDTLISTVRIDAQPEGILFGFADASVDLKSMTTYQELGAADKGAINSSMIEKSLAKGELTKALRRASSMSLGETTLHALDAGRWLPQASLMDGTPLTLSWLQQSGNAIIGEFRLSMDEADKKPEELNGLLGKTYRIAWTLPNPGANTRAQQGEMSVTAFKTSPSDVKIGFYEVDDSLTGNIDGLSPGAPNYEQAALSKAKQSNLMLNDPLISGGSGGISTTKLELMNPSRTYGMVLSGLEEEPIMTSYTRPQAGALYPFKSFLLDQGAVATGIETDIMAKRGDYADFIFTMPDNVSMFN